jgi:hypothetical protein
MAALTVCLTTARAYYLDAHVADTRFKKRKAETQTRPSPPLAGGPTNRGREAAAIFGEG